MNGGKFPLVSFNTVMSTLTGFRLEVIMRTKITVTKKTRIE